MIYNHPRSLRGFAWDSGMIFFDRWVWEWVRCFWKGHPWTDHKKVGFVASQVSCRTAACFGHTYLEMLPPDNQKAWCVCFFSDWTRSAFSKVSCLGVPWQLVAFGVGAQTWMSEPPKPLMQTRISSSIWNPHFARDFTFGQMNWLGTIVDNPASLGGRRWSDGFLIQKKCFTSKIQNKLFLNILLVYLCINSFKVAVFSPDFWSFGPSRDFVSVTVRMKIRYIKKQHFQEIFCGASSLLQESGVRWEDPSGMPKKRWCAREKRRANQTSGNVGSEGTG